MFLRYFKGIWIGWCIVPSISTSGTRRGYQRVFVDYASWCSQNMQQRSTQSVQTHTVVVWFATRHVSILFFPKTKWMFNLFKGKQKVGECVKGVTLHSCFFCLPPRWKPWRLLLSLLWWCLEETETGSQIRCFMWTGDERHVSYSRPEESRRVYILYI